MYSEQYSQIKAKYNFDNLEVVLEVIDKQFGDLFKLGVLNSALKTGHQGSYLKLFDLCMKNLRGLYTPEEVTRTLSNLLETNSDLRSSLTQNHVFIPRYEHGLSSQIGYIEKLVTGQLSTAEPLTYLDMVRSLSWMDSRGGTSYYSIAHINNLAFLEHRKPVLFVNFNKDPKGMPKWGVVDLRDLNKPKVYCEAPLQEGEKLALERGLKLTFTPDVYLGGSAAFSVSTGYTALAWANEHIKRTCALTLASDFYALIEEFTFIQGSSLSLRSPSESSYYSPSYLAYQNQAGGIYALARATILGELGPYRFPANDLCKALEVIAANHVSNLQGHQQVYINARSFVLGLDAALREISLLVENTDTVELQIPETIDIRALQHAYSNHTGEYAVSPAWLENIKRDRHAFSDFLQEDVATAMVLSVFRGRAKKQKLVIDLPNRFQLNEQEQRLIIRFMEANPYVTDLKINNNQSLRNIKEQLTPTFARNRWLAENGYRPPMADNYWKQAAKYWLLHLQERQNVLSAKDENAVFKNCVKEMGIQGLEAVLAFLSDDAERELIERVYGAALPAFYLACPIQQTREYLNALIKHLKQESYFPFSALGVSYQSGNDAIFIELLSEINQLDRFERIVLADVLVNKMACRQFLAALTRHAYDNNWVGLIVIPELENIENASEDLRELCAAYAQLNNVILRNRHLQAAQKILKGIKEVSNFNIDGEALDEQIDTKQIKAGDAGEEEDDSAVDLTLVFDKVDAKATWPLKRGGAVQLQLQQQQQIEQSRQIQQEQQRVHLHTVEESLLGELVDYRNIDRIIGGFFNKFAQEHEIHEKAALLKAKGETLLQGFFHTWVNANPAVVAPQIIHYMTQDAVKSLIHHHQLLPSGINPDNLPKGFYTQRSKDGHLILCYNSELAYINVPNPLTLNLGINRPEGNAWEGDFRQFNLSKYLDSQPQLDSTDWLDVILFAKMQPVSDHTKDIDDFCRANPQVAKRLGLVTNFFSFGTNVERRKKIIDNWSIFIQLWNYAGEKGIAEFLAKDVKEFEISVTTTRQLLLRRQSKLLQDWSATLEVDEAYLRALGQVYYRYGDQGLTLMLTKLRQIDLQLGHDFFKVFSQSVLTQSKNFNCFMHESFFTSMDNMIAVLKKSSTKGALLAWQSLLTRHMKAVGWDNIDGLWRGFSHFVNEIEQLGLALDGSEFDAVNPENMLVCMDRILASLNHIPDAAMQQQFLQRLGSMDRTHGGVLYALQSEHFKYFDDALQLHDFTEGTPTYAPDLKGIFSWDSKDAELRMRRVLASQGQFSHAAYPILSSRLANADLSSKHLLMWFLHTQYSAADISSVIGQVEALSLDVQESIAKHLHRAVYHLGNKYLVIQLDAVAAFAQYCESHAVSLDDLLRQYPHGTVLEAFSLLHQSGRWNDQTVGDLVLLFQSGLSSSPGYPDYLYRESYKLAALFGVKTSRSLNLFYDETKNAKPVVQNELRLLITQLLSIDFATSTFESGNISALWADLLQAIEKMKADPANTAQHRVDLIETLNQNGWQFKYSKNADFRALGTKDVDAPEGLGFFIDHEDRLWKFLQAHIAVPVQGDAKEALQTIIRFLKRLQLNRTYLNEIEPLLSSLEKTPSGRYWSAHYFYQLLRSLQPEDDQVSFPISLLKVILQEETIAAKVMDGVEKDFPALLVAPLQSILKSNVFDRNQQAALSQIVLREFNWQGNIALVPQIMATLSSDLYAESRGHALEILAKCKTYSELDTRYNNCLWLLQRSSAQIGVSEQWTKTAGIWLKAIASRPSVEALFLKVQNQFSLEAEKQALILHILAWSSLHPGLKSDHSFESELEKKAPKLVDRLGEMSPSDLALLARCYPQQPSPGADDILRLIKKRDKENLSWDKCLNGFLRTPFPEPRVDYGSVAITREADLRRMIKATQVSRGQDRTGISPKNAAQLTIIFAYLKNLENGTQKVSGTDKPISAMNQEELAEAFTRLSKQSAENPDDDLLRAQIWALLFEALGRTTRKYPHLAQQFALIANDVCIDAQSRVLQLATGEGKSHFVAMRAARHAASGKVVDICTAKASLAQRDLEDYQSLFSYLGLKASYIHPKSSRETYMESTIHYTTTGSLSLFLDEQSYLGQPINIDKSTRVALFDEFDFIRFEEGRKTEYNYARPIGKTPKQMTWFYKTINDFYTTNQKRIQEQDKRNITKELLLDLSKELQKAAEDNDERQNLVKQILRDPLQLVQWLQSAHEAHELEWGAGFTVIEENIEVGDESYPMREIIPLSSDNQKMAGSTFSAGVHQLLAVRLNKLARLKGEPQNFHIHPESHIISSQVAAQRMKELWGSWEGFSGTISASQASGLHSIEGTEVLHVPTNQRDLRFWHKPGFFSGDNERLQALIAQIRDCLEHQKSILFSCKNDKQVLALKEQLSNKSVANHLTEAELAQFIFYTNEDERSASQVLSDKYKAEQWHGGKKQKGIALVASGFGRGDNVGVEAVFLFNVNDTNDLLQKGGRTARNGEEGEVFQFYLNDEIANEEQVFRQILIAAKIDMGPLDAKLLAVMGDTEQEKCFERVMLLREYVFSLENQANQGYHNVIAQYSAWGMRHLGGLSDPVQRQVLTVAFSHQLKRLEKEWIDISSKEDSTTLEKIQAIESSICKYAGEFSLRYNTETGNAVKEFNLVKQELESIEIVVNKKPKIGLEESAVASICATLMRLLGKASSNDSIEQIPTLIDSLAKNKRRLLSFAKEAASFESIDQLIRSLEFAIEQITNPSLDWSKVSAAAEKELAHEELLVGVGVRKPFEIAMNGLTPALQTKVIEYLRTPNLLTVDERIQAMLPVLAYLSTFSSSKQKLWGAEYIDELENLLHEVKPDFLAISFKNSKPMSLQHFSSLQRIAQRYATNTGHAIEVLQVLGRATQAAPEQRVRMLTKWESWSSKMDLEESRAFLVAFCKTMEHFQEGRDWDGFIGLVNKTDSWWNKGNSDAYKQDILALWQRLEGFGGSLSKIEPFIKWGLVQGGKSWFQVLSLGLKLEPEQLIRYQAKIEKTWSSLNELQGKKSDKTEKLRAYTTAISDFYQLVDADEADALMDKISLLSDERSRRAFELVSEHKGVFSLQPQVFKFLMNCFTDASISLDQLELLSKLLIQVCDYQARTPQMDINYLLSGVERFKEKGVHQLTLLNKMLDRHPDSLSALLFDQVIEALTVLREPVRGRVESVVGAFYQGCNLTHQEPAAIMSSASINRWFNFSDVEAETQRNRVIFMQLLRRQVFITEDSKVENGAGKVYQWNDEQNQELFQLGLNRYIDHTKALLSNPSAKASIHKIRDLSTEQQLGLLRLADEMGQIGSGQISSQSSGQLNELQQDLTQLINRYNASWFKSKSRNEQVSTLERRLSAAMYSEDKGTYASVLQALSEAKFSAMNNDRWEDQTRWFKMNRSGESRFYNTLNQMQDLVLRHWSKDPVALQGINAYQKFNHDEFVRFSRLLRDRMKEVCPSVLDPRSQSLSNRFSTFFTKESDKAKLQSLSESLERFYRPDWQVSSTEVFQLMTTMKSTISALPGHLATVANELMARGDALQQHLEAQERGKDHGVSL